MTPDMVKTAEQAAEILRARDIRHVRVGTFDIDGILRGKYMSRDKFLSALEGGFGFCDVVMGWDSNDQLYDNVTLTGWHTGYPDAACRIAPGTCREIPWEADTLLFLGEFEGSMAGACPRGLLQRMAKKAEDMGFAVTAAAEFEFFLFDETPHSIREKNYKGLKPITPGYFGYSMLRSSVWSDFQRELLAMGETMRLPIEGLHTETGPGVLEAAISKSDVLEAADRAALFKTYTKILAQRHELIACFMAKWSPDWPGQSGHIHMSLADAAGKPLFHDAKEKHGISKLMRHFIGGQQKLLPQILAMVAPTVNAYTRLIPGFWAPTEASWGIENRTCALRVIPGSPKAQRVEFRIAAADGNPYISMAAALGAGLWGIENGIEPTAPVSGNAYAQSFPPELALPRTLWEAAQALKGSDAARSLFGDVFVDHFAATREWEERQFRRAVTDWELQRYFEII
jgi:glutamine synthetase